jgi:hypothetical protein
MELWIANGVQPAWLIDGDAETVHVYRKGQPMRTRRRIRELAGGGPIAGFVPESGSRLGRLVSYFAVSL